MDERPGTVLETAVIETPALDAEPVAHAEPLTDDQLNQQISDTFPELFKFFHEIGQRIATEFGMNGSDAIALLKLDAPMTMKELGQRMGCNPSFVTSIADALEKHGLARREPSLRDRRSKNIVLTPEGKTVRDRLFREILAQAPRCTALAAWHEERRPCAEQDVERLQRAVAALEPYRRESAAVRTAGVGRSASASRRRL